ncbi:hypothetical protein PS914_06340 [Pseudomonas fluorescens]|uniref:RHS repeat-associated core domain-containing protein n=1 Tax=Pseudomonas fluorescens TaxID=294 RepID=UPI00123FA90B|nr:RHS repeat-associated core domain-containing protein [Pseudomonas fluorescens]VVQ19621.1 hypothetical protein PS914_06340 [Pseudomonas fluorescens]
MTARREIPLCHYRYDPLDQLISCATSAQANIQRFYLKDRLATEVQGAVQRSIMQHGDQLLAEHRCEGGTLETTMLATDQQRSVLTALDSTRPHRLAYTPYGHRIPENGLLSLLGFSGERPDPVTGCYLLGNGYRAFNPVLMRFNSPDNLSPFGDGGLNAYTYCAGDPVNRSDPSGHYFTSLRKWLQGAYIRYFGNSPTISSAVVNKSSDIIRVAAPPPAPFNAAASWSTQAHSLPPISGKRNSPNKAGLYSSQVGAPSKLSPANKTARSHKASVSEKPQRGPWNYSKKGAKFSQLTTAEQNKFDEFQNAIHNDGKSYIEAAKLLGAVRLTKTKVAIKRNTYQIRLSDSERVIFSVHDKTVTILQVGGHV